MDRSASRSLDGDAPRWAGIRGVTGDPSRGQELGNAKWKQAARTLDEVARELPTGPARDMDLTDVTGGGRGFWLPIMAVVAVVLVVLVAWMGRRPGPDAQRPKTTAPATPIVAEASPAAPTITVTTDPPGAHLFLDDTDLGPAPAVVAVPLDDVDHQLCVVREGLRSCRQLTGAALASSDPYVFKIR